jgi:predicted NUDIX family NTP pyrophosphohydrolase
MFRRTHGELEVLLAHPGGPYLRAKDEGYWTIPKGEPKPGEALLDVAKREFEEETGLKPQEPFLDLGCIRQKGGKWVFAWGFEGDCTRAICSNSFKLEWPPRSGKLCVFPEIDRAEFFTLSAARRKIKEPQYPLLERLAELVVRNG